MERTERPTAVIFDIDGTLALRREGDGERGPFDWARVGEDLPNGPIIRLAQQLSLTFNIIYMSGRDEVCRPQTVMWLESMGLAHGHLFMRTSGDYRKDSIVKKELYSSYVEPHYAVEFVVDDRDQVVKMWRELGLTCLQVAEGNF